MEKPFSFNIFDFHKHEQFYSLRSFYQRGKLKKKVTLYVINLGPENATCKPGQRQDFCKPWIETRTL